MVNRYRRGVWSGALCVAGLVALAAAGPQIVRPDHTKGAAAASPAPRSSSRAITLVDGLRGHVVDGRLVIHRSAIDAFRRRHQRTEVMISARVPGYGHGVSPYIQITASVLAVADWEMQNGERGSVSLRLWPRADGIAVIVAQQETRVWDPRRRTFLRRAVRSHTFFVRTGSHAV